MTSSKDRILTTHAGSLSRPQDLIAIGRAGAAGQKSDDGAYTQSLSKAVSDVVRKQRELGIDIVDDGEFGKPSAARRERHRWHRLRSRRTHPSAIAWAKLGALAEGARLATRELWT